MVEHPVWTITFNLIVAVALTSNTAARRPLRRRGVFVLNGKVILPQSGFNLVRYLACTVFTVPGRKSGKVASARGVTYYNTISTYKCGMDECNI